MAQNQFSKKNSGQAAITTVIFFVIISVIIGSGLASLGLRQIRSSRILIKSIQAHAASESGLEDVMLRIANNMAVDTSEILTVGESVVETNTQDVGQDKEIESYADMATIIRKTKVVMAQGAGGTGVAFGFGAQVGEGGLIMKNGSTVDGNVFSNGSMVSESNARVLGTIKVAGNGNKINGGKIYGDAYADICNNSYITGDFHGRSKFSCTIFGNTISQNPPDLLPLPITEDDINLWKQSAEDGGIIGPQQIGGVVSLGPVKINGNLNVQNGAELIITGTIWVTGGVLTENNAVIRLDPSYGSASGVLLSDGLIQIQNNNISSGSGTAGSYLMFLSTSSSNPAITLRNNGTAGIVYTNNGYIKLENNTDLRQVTAYGLDMQNNSTVTYEDGLQDVDFINNVGSEESGTFWSIGNWREMP